MEPKGEFCLDGQNKAGIRMSKEEKAALSEIIEALNKRFSTQFNDADKFFLIRSKVSKSLIINSAYGLKTTLSRALNWI